MNRAIHLDPDTRRFFEGMRNALLLGPVLWALIFWFIFWLAGVR